MKFNVNKFTDDKPRLAGLELKPLVIIFIIVMFFCLIVFFAGLWLLIFPVALLAIGVWYLIQVKDRPFLFDELYTYFKMGKRCKNCGIDKSMKSSNQFKN